MSDLVALLRQTAPPPETGVTRPFEFTDLGNARRFAAEHRDRFRFIVSEGRWLRWDGRRWKRDEDGEAMRAAKATVERMLAEAVALPEAERKAAVRHALAAQGAPALRRMLELAGTEPEIALTPTVLDRDPWLLNVANGTLDLRTGRLRAADPDDLISLGTDVSYDPEATCPRWHRFLDEVFAGDAELIAFVQRAAGYSLTGDTSAQVLFIPHGAGCNGKTVFVEVLKAVLGELARTASFESFLRSRDSRSPRNDIAGLHRARLVIASESGEGRRLDAALVKQLTGGDTVAARFLFGEFFEFRPQFKLWLPTNHRPRVDGEDEAMWRRLRLVPFEVSFRGREDARLLEQLEEELPGILRWAVEGCLTWQRDGLGTCEAVEAATAAYRQAEDVLGAFLTEHCTLGRGLEVDAVTLRGAYESYCAEIGERPKSAADLGRALARRGIVARRGAKGARLYAGVAVTSVTHDLAQPSRFRGDG